jgi:hypothetical protein
MLKLKVILPLILLLVSVSCKNRKKYSAPLEVVTRVDTTKEVRPTAENLLGATQKNWTYFSSKANIEYISGENNQNVGSNIRMLKDSLIWISINMFGIEGARILINHDSMVVYDKMNKNYRVYKKELIENILGAPLSVSEIQNLIIAQPIYALKLYEITGNTDACLKIRNSQPNVFVRHSYQKQFYTIDTTMIEDRTAPHYARINYSDFINVSTHNFPRNNRIYAYNGNTVVQINLEFENPDFESPLTFPFTIPSAYERIK